MRYIFKYVYTIQYPKNHSEMIKDMKISDKAREAVENMIRYVRQYGDQVWIATRKEIAAYMLGLNGPADEYVPYQ